MPDCYQLLKLQSTATVAEIQAAFAREHARLGASGTEEENAEALKALDAAYATLIDPGRRAAYDRSLRENPSGSALVPTIQPGALSVPQAPPLAIPQQACPHCGRLNPIQATICASCGKQAARPCPSCGQLVLLNMTVCPRCNTLVPEYDKQRYTDATAVATRIQEERSASEVRVSALEASHRAGRVFGTFFCLAVFLVCIGLMVLTVFLFTYAFNNAQR